MLSFYCVGLSTKIIDFTVRVTSSSGSYNSWWRSGFRAYYQMVMKMVIDLGLSEQDASPIPNNEGDNNRRRSTWASIVRLHIMASQCMFFVTAPMDDLLTVVQIVHSHTYILGVFTRICTLLIRIIYPASHSFNHFTETMLHCRDGINVRKKE